MNECLFETTEQNKQKNSTISKRTIHDCNQCFFGNKKVAARAPKARVSRSRRLCPSQIFSPFFAAQNR